MQTEIIATIIAITAAVLGYAFRELRNRARPFFHITKVDGTVTRNLDRVSLPENVQNILENSFFVKKLSPSPTLAEISKAWGKSNQLKTGWIEIDEQIKKIIRAGSDDEFLITLSDVFKNSFFEKLLLTCLVIDKITINHTLRNDAPERIPIYEEEEYDGSVWICFLPERARQFGNHFKVPAVKAKCQPFLTAIRQFDRAAITSAMNVFLSLMQAEYQTALRVEPPLNDMTNENSRWVFYSYFANMGSSPIIIHRDATVVVNDPSSKPFLESCYLAVIKENSIRDTDTPIVVKPGEDVNLCFITKNIQKKMTLGSAIRDSFKRGQASCMIQISITKIGLIKQQSVWSSKAGFRDSTIEKND